MLETLANLGEFVGAIGVIASVGYLAIQIRQNTRAVRSASYHQAAEQTWSALLAITENEDLARALVATRNGETLAPEAALRISVLDTTLLFGFENMLRLHEEGLLDSEIYRNVVDNSLGYLATPHVQAVLAARPGPLSAKLAAETMRRASELGIAPDEPARATDGAGAA